MAYEGRKRIRGAMKKCPVCGREFWCYDVLQWAYRSRNGAGTPVGWICSWSCQAQHNRESENKRNGRRYHQGREHYKRGADGKLLPDKVIYCCLTGMEDMMRARKINARQLSEATKIPQGTICNYASTRIKCREERIQIIADALGCTVEDLIKTKNGEGTPS